VISSPGCTVLVTGRENPPLGRCSRGHRTQGLNQDYEASRVIRGVLPFVWDLAVLQSGGRCTMVPTRR
jgi:hypothetical protein